MNCNTNGLDQREGFKHRQESTGSPGLSGYWTCFKLLLLRRPPCQQFVRRDNSNRRGKERTENKKETCRHSLVLLFVSSGKEAGHRETTPCSLLDPPPSLSPCPPSLACPTSTYIHTYISATAGRMWWLFLEGDIQMAMSRLRNTHQNQAGVMAGKSADPCWSR